MKSSEIYLEIILQDDCREIVTANTYKSFSKKKNFSKMHASWEFVDLTFELFWSHKVKKNAFKLVELRQSLKLNEIVIGWILWITDIEPINIDSIKSVVFIDHIKVGLVAQKSEFRQAFRGARSRHIIEHYLTLRCCSCSVHHCRLEFNGRMEALLQGLTQKTFKSLCTIMKINKWHSSQLWNPTG